MTNTQKLLMIGGAPWLTRRDYPKLVGGLEAWFDETDPSSMIMDSANRVSLIADKSGNSSTNVLCLNGVAGNCASAPDSVPLSITGDIRLEWYGALVSWASGSRQVVLSKYNSTGNQRGYWLAVTATGALEFIQSTDGTATSTFTSSTTLGLSAFAAKWIRATLDVDNGAAGRTCTFETSDDGVTWSALGTAQTVATAANTFDSTAVLNVGGNDAGAFNIPVGIVYRARIYSTPLGTPALQFDANFPSVAKLAPSFTESSSNAATVTINTSGATGARISGARDRYQGTAASQQVYLPWSGTNYGYLNGVSGNYFSTPDAAPVSVTGSIDLRAYVAADDYTPTGLLYMLISKNTTAAGQFAYDFYINATGNLVFRYSPDGTALRTATSSVATGLTDRAIAWLRATYDSATGNVIFYTGGSADSPVWVQLGSTQVLTSGAIFDGTNAVAIGANSGNSGGFNLFFGTIYRAQIYNGIAGTLAFDFNPVAYVSGTTFLDSSSNAATITINGGAMIVTRSGLYSDGSDDYSKTPGFALVQPTTVCSVVNQVSWTSLDVIWCGSGDLNGALQQHTATPGISTTTDGGVAYATDNNGLPVATAGFVTSVINGASSSNCVNRASETAGSLGSQAMNGFTVGAKGSDGSRASNVFTSEELLFSKNLSSSQRARLALWSARKHRLAAV